MARPNDITAEKQRLISEFPGADDHKLKALDGLIEEVARMRVELSYYDKLVKKHGGTMRIHPENPERQEPLPFIAVRDRTRAAYLNGMDKLMKHLGIDVDDDDDGLSDYE